MTPRNILTVSLSVLFVLAAVPVQAQGGGSDRTKEVIEKIRKEMEEIDRLLNQATNEAADASAGRSGSSGGGSSTSGEGSAKSGVTETLRKTVESQNGVIQKIDELLELAQQRQQQQNQSQGGQKKPQDGKPEQSGERQPDNRMGETPDMIPQGEEPEQSREDEPKDVGPDDERKEKRDAKTAPPESGTERLTGEQGAGQWGELPKYLQGIFRRGGRPEVPAKYRRFEREFHKRANQKKDR